MRSTILFALPLLFVAAAMAASVEPKPLVYNYQDRLGEGVKNSPENAAAVWKNKCGTTADYVSTFKWKKDTNRAEVSCNYVPSSPAQGRPSDNTVKNANELRWKKYEGN